MTATRPTALIADDEPLLRDALERMLAREWPELEIVARARNGREAIELFESRAPDICFLDVQMPGKTGVEAASHIGGRAHIVFVTAYDQYAVQAFAQGVLDYLVKPVEATRLAATVARLQERLRASRPALNTEALLEQLAASLQQRTAEGPLRWLRASLGKTVHLIPVDSIDFLRSDRKYTLVAWRDDDGRPREALIRMPLKEISSRLDPAQFAQVHRSIVVNLSRVDHVTRGGNETGEIHLKNRDDVLPVSRNYLHLFRQM